MMMDMWRVTDVLRSTGKLAIQRDMPEMKGTPPTDMQRQDLPTFGSLKMRGGLTLRHGGSWTEPLNTTQSQNVVICV